VYCNIENPKKLGIVTNIFRLPASGSGIVTNTFRLPAAAEGS